jgi:hypothetical protein
LSSQEKEKLYALLDKHRFLFKGTLGLLPTKPVHVEIKSNAKPFHGRAFSVPKAYESMIRKEVKRLCRLNVLRRCNESEWAAPSFGTPKKNGQIPFISDFCQLSKWITRRSHLLTPLTALTKKNVKFEWTKEHQQAFDLLKNSLAREVVLAYPDFTVPFEIYTDASKYQIGSVITQKDKPLAFYSRKLTDPQTRYTVTELELLAIVETLREYKCILLGHLITIYTDHKNLTFSNFTTDRVTRWRLIVEEYGPNIVYLPGKRNIIADALSRLPKLEETQDESTFLEEIFAFDDQLDAFPIAFDIISKAQLADKKIQQRVTNNDPDFETRILQRAPLVYFKGKIAIPTNLRFRILTWYHENLLHPGADRMFHTISQHFTWPSLRTQVENFVKHCNTCQHYKAQRKKYGHVPVPDKQQIANPWYSIAVTPLDPGSFRSRHTLRNQKSLRHFKHLQLVT